MQLCVCSSTVLVVRSAGMHAILQDTRRLLQAEATALTSELKRRQSAAKLAADKHTAAELGLSDLGRLGERLAGAAVDWLVSWLDVAR